MPPKIRDLKVRLSKAGFEMRPGKGSHTVWRHPLVPQVKLTLSGHDGDDAKHYQVREVNDALKSLKEAKDE